MNTIGTVGLAALAARAAGVDQATIRSTGNGTRGQDFRGRVWCPTIPLIRSMGKLRVPRWATPRHRSTGPTRAGVHGPGLMRWAGGARARPSGGWTGRVLAWIDALSRAA